MANDGRFSKGDDSRRHQLGRPVTKRSAAGYDGVSASGGYIATHEGDSYLSGSQRWKTFANLWRTVPPVSIWARLRQRLLSGIDWSTTANEAGMTGSPADQAAAQRGMEIAEQALLKARLGGSRPFALVAARAMNGSAAFGHSISATAIGRRERDGLIVYTEIAARPQHTISSWYREREDDVSPFVRVGQELPNGRTLTINLADCLYLVSDAGTGSESPAGVGQLELIAERARQLGVYESLLGTEVASSLGGVPIYRAPLQEMAESARGNKFMTAGRTRDEIAGLVVAAIDEKTRPLREFVTKRFKDPLKLAWFGLDSATYETTDGNPSGTPKWSLEIVKGDLQGVTETHPITRDFILDIARMLGVEHVFTGGDSRGSYGLHESQVMTLGADLAAESALFARIAEDQLLRPIIAANGLDPDIATPSLNSSPIMRADVLKAVQAIQALNMAGLSANHPARKAVFEGVDLPWQDEEEPMLPRFSREPLPSPETADVPTIESELERP